VKTVEMRLRPEPDAPLVKVEVLTHEDFEAWLKRGAPLIQRHQRALKEKSAAQWAIGDWLQHATSTLNPDSKPGRWFLVWLEEAANHYGYLVGTFQEFRRVASVFPPASRVPCLSWKHHQAVAAIGVEQNRDAWLFHARIEGWSKTKLQAEMAASREAGTTAPLPAAAPRAYLGRLTHSQAAILAALAKQTGLGSSQVKDLIVSNFLGDPAKVQEFLEAYKGLIPAG
jgi:hypothetical protein